MAQALDSIGDAQVGFGPGELSPSARLLGALQGNAALEALRVVTVAQALGKIGDPRAVPALVSLLQDKDGSVRQAAAEALTALGR